MKFINVWQIELDGNSYLENDFTHVLDLFYNGNREEQYNITEYLITQEEYDRLPEFKGF